MGVPAPPYPSEYMGKTFLQKGGPISVGSGATTAAVTFGTAFPDTSYQVTLEWVSGAPPTQGVGIRAKTVNNVIATFYGTVVDSAFNWGAWRLTA